jgi:hypothetical protein
MADLNSILANVPAAQRAAFLRRLQEVEQVPGPVRALIAAEVIESQRVIKQVIYRSRIRVRSTRTGAGPFTYTVAKGPRTAFGYKIGDSLIQAGYASGVATPAHTNLRTAGGQTNRNADVVIFGMGVEIMPGAEPRLVAKLAAEGFFTMTTDGGAQTDYVGQLTDFPSGGALFGSARTKLEAPNLAETAGPLESFIANGNPMAGNWLMLKKAVRWNSPGGTKKPDTSLAITFDLGEDVTATSTDRAAVAGAAPGASGRVEAFTSPADGAEGTYVDLRVKLLTIEVSDRGSNQ